MKKLILAAAAALFLAFGATAADREHTLKVYNWADYIDEELLGEFEKWYEEQTGEPVTIIYQLFDINEIMLSKIEKGHEDFDVICPSDYIIERMLKNDLLLPINKDFGETPNYLGNVSPFINSLFTKVEGHGKNASDYAVGYMWGVTGFLYNTRFVNADELKTWGAVANPKFAGMLYIKDAFRDVYSPMLVHLKQEELKNGTVTLEDLMWDASDESIALVEEYLKSIKDNVQGWEADFGKEQMTKEKAWLNLTWSGDAQWAIEEAAEVNVPLAFVVPEEGSNVWFDGWCIPKYAKNVKAASYFINFLCKPENALRNMDAIGYVSAIGGDVILDAIQDSTEFAPIDASYFFGEDAKSVCINSIMYPDKAVIDNCAMMHDSGDRTEALLEMWSRVKGDNASALTYIIIAIAAVAIVGILVARMSGKKKGKHAKRS